MDIQKMHTYFEQLLDKLNSAGFTADEIDLFLQRAEVSVVNDYFLNRFENLGENFNQIPGIISSSEARSSDAMILKPLMTSITSDTNGSGELSDTIIEGKLGGEYLHVLAATRDGEWVRWMRHNDFGRSQKNSFKKAKDEKPQMRVFNTKLKFTPEAKATIVATLLKAPKKVSLSGGVDSELPDAYHNEVVNKAVQLAAIANRDNDLRTITQG